MSENENNVVDLNTEILISIRDEITRTRTDLRAEISSLRTELHTEVAGLRSELQQVRGGLATLEEATLLGFSGVRRELSQLKASNHEERIVRLETEIAAIRGRLT